MIDANSKTARAITATAVLAAAAMHCTMNYQFSSSLGANDVEKQVFAIFGASLDICKVFALAFAAHAWDRGRKVKALACFLVWATTVAYSGTAALGFAALARDTVVASRSTEADDYQINVTEVKRLQSQMEQSKLSPLFVASYGCTDYNKAATKGEERRKAEFCHQYWRASAHIGDLKPQLKSATLTQADPQTMVLAKITGFPRETVAMGLAVFLAIVAEIVSALGGWAFSRTIRQRSCQP